jgi:hypothetical protein
MNCTGAGEGESWNQKRRLGVEKSGVVPERVKRHMNELKGCL